MKIRLLAFSITLFPIWGLGLLSLDYSNQLTLILSTFITIVFQIELFKIIEQKKDAYLTLLSPSIYLILAFFTTVGSNILLHPVFWATLCSIIAAIIFIRRKSIKLCYYTISPMIVYSIFIYPHSIYNHQKLDQEIAQKIDKNNLAKHNLKDFKFINSQNDTLKLNIENKLVIETWNEACPPCIKSIMQLQDSLIVRENLDYIYLYQFNSKKDRELNKIFNQKQIKDKSKILVDIENNLFDALGLNSYPYYFIVDSSGLITTYRNGFTTDSIDVILNWIDHETKPIN